MPDRDNAAASLSFRGKAGFAIGDYACNLYWQSISLFLMFYYTDVVGLSAGTAGLIYMIASIFDGAIDPLMGAVADRTRTRWGRYRPWILAGALPLGLSFAGLYWKPAATGLGLLAIVLVTHLFFRVAYTAVSIPYCSLTARITQRSDERSSLAGFRMFFATLAGLTVSFLTQPMVAWFGGGDAATGFFYAACVIATIATAILPIVVFNTREPVLASDSISTARLSDYWRAIRVNRAFWLVMIAVTSAALCSTVIGKSILYYYKYFVHDEASARYALSAKAAAGLLIIPAWVQVTKFTDKRGAWFVASSWAVGVLLLFALLDVRDAIGAGIVFLLLHVATLGLNMTYWSMLPDTVEYGEWRSGLRTESFIFGFGIFFQKVALGVAAGVFGIALDWVGFVPNVEQSQATLAGIKLVMICFPLAGLAIAAVAIWHHPLRRGVHDRISNDLVGRQMALAPADPH
ncbi:MFS transporter [Hephaestia sp. GCM10023244]|uniref:MFS transporter n=1 Tax=unclassified Hephaestia TaxID=2631281 RepID=UPI002076DA6E|nr:glycoside-pentoside-hexuronide (GPH):cation symporter [Hephaestia sp. MAHUQ-44]MCM8729363.1 glycoside-pentoside-hexuronide (GPH):cation symporter [Hephaestia sp. MAHUQ-44]